MIVCQQGRDRIRRKGAFDKRQLRMVGPDSSEFESGRHAEIASPAAPARPEQVGMVALGGHDLRAVCQNHLQRQHLVAAETKFLDRKLYPPPSRKPATPTSAHAPPTSVADPSSAARAA